ncbi:MAG: hypothetical protein SVV03_03165 [Candidatus Nanohaloarchaea archaeon]|nr:hypothetical protein [Candidatus Nanohaloarchaea archaeon]
MSDIECKDCNTDFSSEKKLLEHRLDSHGDEMSSHDRDEVKTRLNKLEAQSQEEPIPTKTIMLGVLGVIVFAGAAYGLVTSGIIQLSTDASGVSSGSGSNVTVGRLGSAHHHAQFSVEINGREINFARPRYQMQSKFVHFEGDGSTIHKHATGVSIGYVLETLGMDINSTCIETYSGSVHCEGGSSKLKVRVNGQEIGNPASHVIMDGENIEIVYSSS